MDSTTGPGVFSRHCALGMQHNGGKSPTQVSVEFIQTIRINLFVRLLNTYGCATKANDVWRRFYAESSLGTKVAPTFNNMAASGPARGCLYFDTDRCTKKEFQRQHAVRRLLQITSGTPKIKLL